MDGMIERVFAPSAVGAQAATTMGCECGCTGTFAEKDGHDAVLAKHPGATSAGIDEWAVAGDMQSIRWW
jgi:hypothetical protein